MQLVYRISDKSYPKQKLIGATKEVCLMNFCSVFREVIFGKGEPSVDHVPPMAIIADNCERKTVKMVMDTGIPVIIKNDGNAGSLRTAISMALTFPDDELFYFVEDDYLHLQAAPKLLEEGIRRSDYVTLYDHPDKYTSAYNGGEFSKVIKTASSHWRYTVSTCMTFATKVKTLREDNEIWQKYIDGDHPHDHHIFTELNKTKNRRLAVCIPGAACHTDLEFSSRAKQMLIEPWAIQMMIVHREEQLNEIKHKLAGCGNEDKYPDFLQLYHTMTTNKSGSDLLMALDALYHQYQ